MAHPDGDECWNCTRPIGGHTEDELRECLRGLSRAN